MLFRRHVREGARSGTGRRDQRHGRAAVIGPGLLRQSEVEHFDHVAVGLEHDVLRLDVAMHDGPRVGLCQRIGDLLGDRHQLALGQRALAQALRQRVAFDVLHREERPAAVFADFVDRAHVRVIERGRGLRFANQARVAGLVTVGSGDDLDCHEPLQRRILREVHLAHAAGAELAQNAIPADGLGRHPALLSFT